jgi:hypothetical protein
MNLIMLVYTSLMAGLNGTNGGTMPLILLIHCVLHIVIIILMLIFHIEFDHRLKFSNSTHVLIHLVFKSNFIFIC